MVTGSGLNFEKASAGSRIEDYREQARGRKSVFIYLYIMGSYCMYCFVTCLFFFLNLCHTDLSHST